MTSAAAAKTRIGIGMPSNVPPPGEHQAGASCGA